MSAQLMDAVERRLQHHIESIQTKEGSSQKQLKRLSLIRKEHGPGINLCALASRHPQLRAV